MPENEKRLQFLSNLLIMTNTSKHELARVMGVSAQNIFTYFQRDDMKLSYAQEVASRLGYTLTFSLEGKKEAKGILQGLDELLRDGQIGRLAFLQIAMKLNGIERKELAQRLELFYTGVNRWFKVDDIAISYLFKIAELYGLKLGVSVKKTGKAKAEAINLL